MLVIVDGVDLTGKSTLCERLRNQFGGGIIHFGPPETDPVEEYLAPLMPYSPRSSPNLFVDRHYLGETVWPMYFKRETLMTDRKQAQIEDVLERLGATCVLAVRDPSDLNRANVEAGEPTGDQAWLVQIVFQSHAAHSHLQWIEYDEADPTSYDEVVEAALDRSAQAQWEVGWSGVIR